MTPDHRFASARLCSYRDGALPGSESRRVQGHLARCEECRTSLAELTVLAGRLRASSAPVPDGLAERVIAHLDAQSSAARLSVVASAAEAVAPRRAGAAAVWGVARAHLTRTLPLALVIGLLVTLLKDLGALLADGFTFETCVVCGANFVLAFVVLNLGLLLAVPRQGRR